MDIYEVKHIQRYFFWLLLKTYNLMTLFINFSERRSLLSPRMYIPYILKNIQDKLSVFSGIM